MNRQVCWKRCSVLGSVHLITYSSLYVAVYRLETKTLRHPSVTTAARGAKTSWSPAKDKCDQISVHKQMPIQLHAHTPHNTRCQLIGKKHKNAINLQVCFDLFMLMETSSGCGCLQRSLKFQTTIVAILPDPRLQPAAYKNSQQEQLFFLPNAVHLSGNVQAFLRQI